MIKKLSLSLLLGVLIGSQSIAGLPPTTIQGQSGTKTTTFNFQVPYNLATGQGGPTSLIETGNTNGLVNPSFEASTVATGWTALTHVTSAVNTSTYVDGKQSITLSTDGTGTTGAQTLWYQDWTPGAALNPLNGESDLYVTTTLTTLQVCPRIGGVTITTACSNVQPNGSWAKYAPTFIFPTSGSVGVALYTTATIAPSTTIGSLDKAYVGLATNMANVSQTQVFGTLDYAPTASCNWTQAATGSFTSFPANTNCPTPTLTGNAQAPASKIPGITFATMPPGSYYFVINAVFQSQASLDGNQYFQMTDGTTAHGVVFTRSWNTNSVIVTNNTFATQYDYTTAQSNVTFQMQGKASSASAAAYIDGNNVDFRIMVYYFPSQQSLGINPGQQWQPTVQKLLSGSSTYTTPQNVSRIEVKMVGGGGGGGAGGSSGGTAATAGGNTTFGSSLLTANGGGAGGWNAAPGTGGTASVTTSATVLQVVAVAGGGGGGGGSTSASSNYLPSGIGGSSAFGGAGTAGSGTGQPQGGAAATNSGSGGGGSGATITGDSTGSGGGAGGYVDAIINYPLATYAYAVGGAGSGQAGGTTAGGAGGSGAIIVTEYYYNSAVQFAGQLSSNTSGQDRVEHAGVANSCTSGTCTLISPTLGISSITHTGTGTYLATYTAYSAAPELFFSSQTSTIHCEKETAPTTTTAAFTCRVGSTGTATDDGFSVLILGPR